MHMADVPIHETSFLELTLVFSQVFSSRCARQSLYLRQSRQAYSILALFSYFIYILLSRFSNCSSCYLVPLTLRLNTLLSIIYCRLFFTFSMYWTKSKVAVSYFSWPRIYMFLLGCCMSASSWAYDSFYCFKMQALCRLSHSFNTSAYTQLNYRLNSSPRPIQRSSTRQKGYKMVFFSCFIFYFSLRLQLYLCLCLSSYLSLSPLYLSRWDSLQRSSDFLYLLLSFSRACILFLAWPLSKFPKNQAANKVRFYRQLFARDLIIIQSLTRQNSLRDSTFSELSTSLQLSSMPSCRNQRQPCSLYSYYRFCFRIDCQWGEMHPREATCSSEKQDSSTGETVTGEFLFLGLFSASVMDRVYAAVLCSESASMDLLETICRKFRTSQHELRLIDLTRFLYSSVKHFQLAQMDWLSGQTSLSASTVGFSTDSRKYEIP